MRPKNVSVQSAGRSAEIVSDDLNYMLAALRSELELLSGKDLLITGGAGFLGYYLVQTVLQWNRHGSGKPVRVTVCDNYIRGIPGWLEGLRGDEHLTLRAHDITSPLPATLGAFHYIIHAASIASPTYYRKYPIETMDANVVGLRNMLEYCRRQKETGRPIEGLLFFSSSEIYGDPEPENIPTPETCRGRVSSTGPRACYDESKRYGETLCVNFVRVHDLPVTIARPFNNYGPGLRIDDRRVIPDFARNILLGQDILLLSDGSPTRTYCYIADATIGYYKVLTRGRRGEAYNIGNDEGEISVAVLARKMAAIAADLLGYEGHVRFGASPDRNYLTDNPDRRCPLLTKARQELGYSPKVSLDEGLRRSLLWYQDEA